MGALPPTIGRHVSEQAMHEDVFTKLDTTHTLQKQLPSWKASPVLLHAACIGLEADDW